MCRRPSSCCYAMSDAAELPKGWSREEVVRKTGLSAGKTDIYYYGPDGKKYRSKPQIARELGETADLSAFDFKTGRMMSQQGLLKRAKNKKSAYDYSKVFRGDSSFALPVRQTASIFKQPVTVIRSHPDSKVRTDLKHGPADSPQPRQLFWEYSLTGLKCCDVTEEVLQSIDLPPKIQGITSNLTTENLLQSIAAALHMGSQPVVGQSQPSSKFIKNPSVHINTNQPLLQQVSVTDDDIRQQERKVESARKKLEDLLAAIERSNREIVEHASSNQSLSEEGSGMTHGNKTLNNLYEMDTTCETELAHSQQNNHDEPIDFCNGDEESKETETIEQQPTSQAEVDAEELVNETPTIDESMDS